MTQSISNANGIKDHVASEIFRILEHYGTNRTPIMPSQFAAVLRVLVYVGTFRRTRVKFCFFVACIQTWSS